MSSTPIYRFAGEHRWLSNFWPAPVEFDGYTYPSVEHAYQAAKTFDPTSRQIIKGTSTPGLAKRMGRGIALRRDWDAVKLIIMEELVHEKFSNHPDLKAKLLATGDRPLFEGNNWGDRFWGVCAADDGGMIGENHLGKILMKVREELRRA